MIYSVAIQRGPLMDPLLLPVLQSSKIAQRYHARRTGE